MAVPDPPKLTDDRRKSCDAAPILLRPSLGFAPPGPPGAVAPGVV